MNLQTNKSPDGNTSIKLYLITIIILWKSICDSINNNIDEKNEKAKLEDQDENENKTKITITDEEYKNKFANKRREDIKKFKSLDVFKNEKDKYLKDEYETYFNNYTLNENNINTNLNKIKENISKYAQIVKENNKTKENKKFELEKKIAELKKKYTDSYTDYIKLITDYKKHYTPSPEKSPEYTQKQTLIEKELTDIKEKQGEIETKIINLTTEKNTLTGLIPTTEGSGVTDIIATRNKTDLELKNLKEEKEKKNIELRKKEKELEDYRTKYTSDKTLENNTYKKNLLSKIVPTYYDKKEEWDAPNPVDFDKTGPQQPGNLKKMYDALKKEEIVLEEIGSNYVNIFNEPDINNFVNNFDIDYKNYFEKKDFYMYDFGRRDNFNLIFKLETTSDKTLKQDEIDKIEQIINIINNIDSNKPDKNNFNIYNSSKNKLKNILKAEGTSSISQKVKTTLENKENITNEKLNNILEELDIIFSKPNEDYIKELLKNRLRLIKLIEIDRCNEIIKNKKKLTKLNEKKLKKTEIDNNRKIELIKNLNNKLYKNFPESQRHELFKIYFIQYKYLYENNCFKNIDDKEETNTFKQLKEKDIYPEIDEVANEIKKNNISILKTIKTSNLVKLLKNILSSYFTKNNDKNKKQDMEVIFNEPKISQKLAVNMLEILKIFYELPNMEKEKTGPFYVRINGVEKSKIVDNFLDNYGMKKITGNEEELKKIEENVKIIEDKKKELETTQQKTTREENNKKALENEIETSQNQLDKEVDKLGSELNIEFEIEEEKFTDNVGNAYNDIVGLSGSNENVLLKYIEKKKEFNKYESQLKIYTEALKIQKQMEDRNKINKLELEILSLNRQIQKTKDTMNTFKKDYITNIDKIDTLAGIYYNSTENEKDKEEKIKQLQQKKEDLKKDLEEGEVEEKGDIEELLKETQENINKSDKTVQEKTARERRQSIIEGPGNTPLVSDNIPIDPSVEGIVPEDIEEQKGKEGKIEDNILLFENIFNLVKLNYDKIQEQSPTPNNKIAQWSRIGSYKIGGESTWNNNGQKVQQSEANIFDIKDIIEKSFGTSLQTIIEQLPELKQICLKSIMPKIQEEEFKFLNPTFKILNIITPAKIKLIWDKKEAEFTSLWEAIKENLKQSVEFQEGEGAFNTEFGFDYWEILKLTTYKKINKNKWGQPYTGKATQFTEKNDEKFDSTDNNFFIFPLALFYIISFITYYLSTNNNNILRAKINAPVHFFEEFCMKGVEGADSIDTILNTNFRDIVTQSVLSPKLNETNFKKNNDFIKQSITVLLLMFYCIQKNNEVLTQNNDTLKTLISTKVMLIYLLNVIENSYEFKNIEKIQKTGLLTEDGATDIINKIAKWKGDTEPLRTSILQNQNLKTDLSTEEQDLLYKLTHKGGSLSKKLVESKNCTIFIIRALLDDEEPNRKRKDEYEPKLKELCENNTPKDISAQLTKIKELVNGQAIEIFQKDFCEKYNPDKRQCAKNKIQNTKDQFIININKVIDIVDQQKKGEDPENIVQLILTLRHKHIKQHISDKGNGEFWNTIFGNFGKETNLEIITRLRTLPHENNQLHKQLLFWTHNNGNEPPNMFILKDVFNTKQFDNYKLFAPSLTITDYTKENNPTWLKETDDTHHYKPIYENINTQLNKNDKDTVTLFAYGPSGAGKTYYLYKQKNELSGLINYLLKQLGPDTKINISHFSPEIKYTDKQNPANFKIKSKSFEDKDNLVEIFKELNDRTEEITDNNNNSSRDHMCITITLKIGDNNKKIIIADFAGREGVIKYSSFRNKIKKLFKEDKGEFNRIIFKTREEKIMETINSLNIKNMIDLSNELNNLNYFDKVFEELPKILKDLEKMKESFINDWYNQPFEFTELQTLEDLEKKLDIRIDKSNNKLKELIKLLNNKNTTLTSISMEDLYRFFFDTLTNEIDDVEKEIIDNLESNKETKEEEIIIKKINYKKSNKILRKVFKKFFTNNDSIKSVNIKEIKHNKGNTICIDSSNKVYKIENKLNFKENIQTYLVNLPKIIMNTYKTELENRLNGQKLDIRGSQDGRDNLFKIIDTKMKEEKPFNADDPKSLVKEMRDYIKNNRPKDNFDKDIEIQNTIAQEIYNEVKIINLWLNRLYEGYVINESLDIITRIVKKINPEKENPIYIQSESDYNMNIFKVFAPEEYNIDIPSWSLKFLDSLNLLANDVSTFIETAKNDEETEITGLGKNEALQLTNKLKDLTKNFTEEQIVNKNRFKILLLLVLNIGNENNTSLDKQYIDLKDYYIFKLFHNIKSLTPETQNILLLLLFYFHNENDIYSDNEKKTTLLNKFLQNKAKNVFTNLGEDLPEESIMGNMDKLKNELDKKVKDKINTNESTFFGILDYVYNRLYHNSDFSKIISYDSFWGIGNNSILKSVIYVNPIQFVKQIVGDQGSKQEQSGTYNDRQKERYIEILKNSELGEGEGEGVENINCIDVIDCDDKLNKLQDLLSSISSIHPWRNNLEERKNVILEKLKEMKNDSSVSVGGKKINKKKELEKLRNKYFKLKQK